MTMEAQRWQRVRQLVEEALEQPEGERAQFLAAACQSDESLCREAASLMDAAEAASRFIEQPPAWLAAEVATLAAGTEVDRYRIVSLLGRGGMGDVYLADDTELGRQVALKFLPADVASDTGRLRRFEAEARAASALNHPNIITIFEIGRRDPAPFLVTEYIDGHTLRQQLAGGALDFRTALDEAIQIADALAAAHRAGITHRDLKPENAMVRRDGLVKVLDFGLATRGGSKPPAADGAAVTARGVAGLELTTPGTVMGTASYMSPEQARGLEVGAPSDLFSFGALLYEMVTGRPPFSGVNMIDVLASVLAREPRPVKELRADVPDGLQPIIDTLLCKDIAGRYATADAVIADLKALRRLLEPAAARGLPIPSLPKSWSRRRLFARFNGATAAAGTALVLIAAVSSYVILQPSVVLTDKDFILLADFENQTGDAAFDDVLKPALAVQLEQSPFFSIFPEAKVREALLLMRQSAGDRVNRETGREICQRLGVKALLAGSIYPIRGHYAVALDAIKSETGEVVAHEAREALRKEQVLPALAAATTEMRRRLGESLASIHKFDAPVEQATTSSLEALKIFNMGRQYTSSGRGVEAIALYKSAVELDPNFALAWSELANAYSSAGQHPLKVAAAEKAFSLRGRVSEREQFQITSDYYTDVTHELAKAIQIYQQWEKVYPRDIIPAVKLGNRYVSLGMYEAAVEQLQATYRLEPEDPAVLLNLARALLRLNRFEQAEAVVQEALQKKIDTQQLRQVRFDLAFVRGDAAAMQRAIVEARGHPQEEYDRAYDQGEVAAFGGRLRKAGEFFRQTADLVGVYKLPPQQKGWVLNNAALSNVWAGRCQEAKTSVQRALAASRHLGILKGAIPALAQCGEIELAQALYHELAGANLQDDLVLREVTLPGLQAQILLARRQPERVSELLKASPYERAGGFGHEQFGGFWFSWLRGQAFLALKNGTAAAGEFQRILDHRGLLPKSTLWPLAHLELARALALTGARDESRKRYEQFLDLWKDADLDAPALIDAKREYRALSERLPGGRTGASR